MFLAYHALVYRGSQRVTAQNYTSYSFTQDFGEYKDLQRNSIFVNRNDVEGSIIIEIWNYPPLRQDYADPISLYLTLRDDRDPRTEKELEIMINKLW